MPYTTRTEQQQERQEVTVDILGILMGILRKLMPEDDALKAYTALAGDSSAEVRARIGSFCADEEHRIDRRVAEQRRSIEYSYRFALKATTNEERDTWNDGIRVHVEMIHELQDLRTECRRLLHMVTPWPELTRMALLEQGTGRHPNIAPISVSLERDLRRALENTNAPPPPPLPEGSEEGEESRDQSAPTS